MGDYDDGAGGDYANPFQDSAVVNAMDDEATYNSDIGPGSAFYKGAAAAPAARPPTYGVAAPAKGSPTFVSAFDPPPAVPQAGPVAGPSQNASMDERELKRREAQALHKGPHAPNWPRCRPCIYHSIRDEIEVPLQGFVRTIYYSWYLVCACVLLNTIACLLLLTSAAAQTAGSDFGWSILYLLLIPPAAFFLWYRPVYNAFMKDSSMYYYIYFFFNFFHIAFVIYILIGLPGTGSAGFINMLSFFPNHPNEGAVGAIAVAFWGVALAIHLVLFFRVRKHYKSRGHSFEEARSQAISSAASSKAAREAVTSAATSAATGYARQYDEV